MICEGNLIFADNIDMEFHANYILIRRGKLIIGTTAAPYSSNLVISLHGNYWDA